MKELKRYTFAGILFVVVLGTLAHFFYAWSGENFIVGLFSPVNESAWEHMKLTFFPMLIYSLFMNRKLRIQHSCITSSLCTGILLSTALIPVIFYTYSGILGFDNLILDIITFIVAVVIGFAATYSFTLSGKVKKYELPLKILVLLMAILFLVFTYLPPKIPLFAPPEM